MATCPPNVDRVTALKFHITVEQLDPIQFSLYDVVLSQWRERLSGHTDENRREQTREREGQQTRKASLSCLRLGLVRGWEQKPAFANDSFLITPREHSEQLSPRALRCCLWLINKSLASGRQGHRKENVMGAPTTWLQAFRGAWSGLRRTQSRPCARYFSPGLRPKRPLDSLSLSLCVGALTRGETTRAFDTRPTLLCQDSGQLSSVLR